MTGAGSGLVLTGIGELVSGDPALPSRLADAAVVCGADGTLLWAGPGSGLPRALSSLPLDGAPHRADLGGRAVVPGFVDSHTHLVFAGQRGEEWEARMAGQPYAAGGIRATVAATRAASDTGLAAGVERLAAEALASGTTTLEVKSGYGLDLATEPRLLRAAGRVTDDRTWLGAHVVPAEYADRPDDYVDLVCGPMLDACAPLARWADVFCERGAFDADQSRAVLLAARAAGLGLRVHGNQLGPGPGVALAVELGAASVDHCTHLSATDVEALAAFVGPGRAGSGAPAPGTGGASAGAASGQAGGTVATLLPTAEFSTRSPYPDARRLLDAGVRVALASDCNPGSSYTTSMPLVIALAVREMGMTVPEAVDAATAGGADALRRSDVGRLVPGAQADLVVLEAPSSSWLGYRPGVALVRGVVRSGVLVAGAFP